MEIKLNIDENKIIDREYLVERLADKIIKERIDKKWDEFNKELLEAIKIAVKSITDEYMTEYLGKEQVKSRIRANSFTKEELLKIITT